MYLHHAVSHSVNASKFNNITHLQTIQLNKENASIFIKSPLPSQWLLSSGLFSKNLNPKVTKNLLKFKAIFLTRNGLKVRLGSAELMTKNPLLCSKYGFIYAHGQVSIIQSFNRRTKKSEEDHLTSFSFLISSCRYLSLSSSLSNANEKNMNPCIA